MHNDDLPDRVSLLSAQLLNVLALMAEGLSNGQIASTLGYNNAYVVGTYVYMINKKLGLTSIRSALEKRHRAMEAFKNSRAEPLKIQISIGPEAGIKSNSSTRRQMPTRPPNSPFASCIGGSLRSRRSNIASNQARDPERPCECCQLTH